jgi:hypothetical protein
MFGLKHTQFNIILYLATTKNSAFFVAYSNSKIHNLGTEYIRRGIYLELHQRRDRRQRQGEVWSGLLEIGVANAARHALAQHHRGQGAGGRAQRPGRRTLGHPLLMVVVLMVMMVVVRVQVGGHDALFAGRHATDYMLPRQR